MNELTLCEEYFFLFVSTLLHFCIFTKKFVLILSSYFLIICYIKAFPYPITFILQMRNSLVSLHVYGNPYLKLRYKLDDVSISWFFYIVQINMAVLIIKNHTSSVKNNHKGSKDKLTGPMYILNEIVQFN